MEIPESPLDTSTGMNSVVAVPGLSSIDIRMPAMARNRVNSKSDGFVLKLPPLSCQAFILVERELW
eukprot:scaffold1558_cov403-Prasinococcus_capsulatus_cf.AAC.18